MNDEYLALLIDLHVRQKRQGPGGAAETAKAMGLAGIEGSWRVRIADIGCGTGASALQLAAQLDAEVVALDFLPEFIDALASDAKIKGLSGKIEPVVCSMQELPFAEQELDVIWSEGAIYNIGFERGVREWKRFLKPGGVLVVSEVTWTTASRPAEIEEYWAREYKEIAEASSKIAVLEESGYSPVAYFVLPEKCWLQNYYEPLERQLPEFLQRHQGSKAAIEIAEAERRELAMYKKYRSYYGYAFYIAKATG